MTPYLLDVNVLVALAWPSHVLHERVVQWFEKRAGRGWATCPFTETAFVRILSNPAFSPLSLTPAHAFELLEKNLAHSNHVFWPADLKLSEALRISRLKTTGHQQITDAYLLGLAIHKKGMLATCDQAFQAAAGGGRNDRHFVEMIR